MVEQLHDGIVARPDPTACPDKNLLSRIPSEAMSTFQLVWENGCLFSPPFARAFDIAEAHALIWRMHSHLWVISTPRDHDPGILNLAEPPEITGLSMRPGQRCYLQSQRS